MRSFPIELTLDPSSEVPIFLQIATTVVEDIRRGRLRPGAVLPGTRTLAESLGVHRNTVLAAYRELSAQGWIDTTRATKTTVSASMPELPVRKAGRAREVALRCGFDLAPKGPVVPEPPPASAIVLSGGTPDLRLLPVELIARAYRRALHRSAKTLLNYGDPRGDEPLREALASMLTARRGLGVTAADIIVTRGSQMALDLTARALLAPGDVVAVEALGYRPAWEALGQTGARLVPIALDEEGLSMDALDALAERERVRAVYVTPHHQYPSTVTLSPGRRIRLLELARRKRFAVIEDDYDHELHFEGRPILPLASADRAGVVIYIGTLSKILAPGLRIGFVVAPAPLTNRLAAIRMYVDRQGDLAVERAVAELLEDDEVQRHARRMRRIYQTRRDVLVDALQTQLAGVVDVQLPSGGMALWVHVQPDIDIDAWTARARDCGVIVHAGRYYAFDGRTRPYFRAGFALLDENELREAIRRLRVALKPKNVKHVANKPA